MKKQGHREEISSVSTLPEIMVLGSRGGKKANHCEQPFSHIHRTKRPEEDQEENSCTQLNPGALQWDYKQAYYSNIRLNTI